MDNTMAAFDNIIATAPDAARELFVEYRSKRDANDRAKIKVKIKVLLDILSLDTTYPPVPEPVKQTNRIQINAPGWMPAQAPRLGDPQMRDDAQDNQHEGAPANGNGNHQAGNVV